MSDIVTSKLNKHSIDNSLFFAIFPLSLSIVHVIGAK